MSWSPRRGAPEAEIQRDIVRMLRAVLPRGAIVHHSAHEVRGGSEWARNQQAMAVGMGVHRGFADLIVLSQGRVLFLEVKAPGGRASTDQQMFCAAVEAQGHGYRVVRSSDDALAALQEYNFKTRLVG